jgi:hypothetical protein
LKLPVSNPNRVAGIASGFVVVLSFFKVNPEISLHIYHSLLLSNPLLPFTIISINEELELKFLS